MRFIKALGSIWAIVRIQVKESLRLVSRRKTTDVVLFYAAYPYFGLPALAARLFRLPSVEVATRVLSPPKGVVGYVGAIAERTVTSISPELPSLVGPLTPRYVQRKLVGPGLRSVDLERYSNTTPYNLRPVQVSYFGRLEREKGVLSFLEAARIIAASRKDVRFVIAGSGQLAETVQKFALEFARDTGSSMDFLGFLPETEVPSMLASSRLLVLPTGHSEGFPTVIMEAMACGTPVLATRVGAIEEAIQDSETGFLLNSTEPSEIAQGIVRALEPGSELVSMRARRFAEETFSRDAAVERYSTLLEGAIQRSEGLPSDEK